MEGKETTNSFYNAFALKSQNDETLGLAKNTTSTKRRDN